MKGGLILLIIDITNEALKKFDDIYEFRAFTQFAYKVFNDCVSRGYKVNTIIPHTNQNASEKDILSKLKIYEKNYLLELSFQHIVSLFEAWFFDLLRFILSDTNKLNKNSKIDIGEIVNLKNKEEIIQRIIDREINELQYKNPRDWFANLWKFVNINEPKQDEIEQISEIKASRDILVHNKGIANQIYLNKSGKLARVGENEIIPITSDYFNNSWALLKDVIQKVGNLVAAKIDSTPPYNSSTEA